MTQAQLGKYFPRSHLQNNQSKMGWRCGSIGRTPVLQVQSPEFTPQSHQIKKKKKKKSWWGMRPLEISMEDSSKNSE
jgi:hypothetical protein